MLQRLTSALSDRYRIERELGEGGMATVYLAEDLKHDRKVAVKVLKPELTAVLGGDRFIQEIKTTAQLQHPHILPLFDSGTVDGFLFYVMPYIEGETLRDKLDRETQLGVEEAVRITREIADALDYAHRHGIIHRDIKPENILLHDGRPMVADFGIALAVSAAAGGRMTETGTSVGTPHYMSPEQATADKELTGRADIYSLASVLYEMLAGEPPHTGGSAQAVIMKIIAEPVQPVTKLRKSVPPNVAAAVGKALEKLPADRFESAKAFADALADPAFLTAALAATGEAARGAHDRRPFAAAVGVAALASALALWGWLRPGPGAPMAVREVVLGSMGTAPGILANGTAVAPDGSAIVYVDTSSAGQYQLMLKERDRLAPRVLASLTVDRPRPSFSPDGQSIAFTDTKLFRVSREGGAPVVLSDSAVDGTAWLDDGTLISIDRGSQGLLATPSSGGVTRRVLTTDSAGTVFLHVAAIPGAEAVVATTGAPNAGALVLDLPSGQARPVQEGAVNAWVVGGRLLFAQANGALYSVPFDTGQLSVSGAPAAVLDSIQMDTDPMRNQTGDITVGRDGTLLYVRASPLAEGAQPHLVRVSLDGAAEPLDPGRGVPVSLLGGLDLSPDGGRLAVSLTDPSSGRNDIYVVDVRGGSSTRLTFSGTSNTRPQFSPDGASIMYVSDAGGALQLWVKPADGSGAATLLVSDLGAWGGEWSPDMRWIVYRTDAVSTGNRDIYAVRADGDTTRVPLAATPASEMGPAISPDGRWLAYSSDVSGTDQVYVQPFPEAAGAVWQVSSGNGYAPRWSHDGRRIFYQNRRDQVIAADVSTAPTFTVIREEVLFSGRQYISYEYYHTYAVAPDDRHLFMLELPPAALGAGARLVEVQNWLSGR